MAKMERGFHRHYVIWACVIFFLAVVLVMACWCFGEVGRIIGTVLCVLILIGVAIWAYVTQMNDKRESEEANTIE